MNKYALYTGIITLSFSLNAYALGLGGISVHSYLNQPFEAEIELIDLGNVPLSGIKASLASVEDYERVGLERVYAVSLLTFSVEENTAGKPIIKVRSTERLSDPFMQILVDLAWAEGQVYRSYTVLLDPPNYQQVLVKKQISNLIKRQSEEVDSSEAGVIDKPVYTHLERNSSITEIDKRGMATYGPTLKNETIWQIAQRYNTDDLLLQQIILAIVGTNPQSFVEGNLNGLKEKSHLQIPTNITASKVPAALAKLEVLAHDKAWQSHQPIEHILLPPYIDAPEAKSGMANELSPLGYPITVSKIPSFPFVIIDTTPEADSTVKITDDSDEILSREALLQQEKIRAAMDVAAAAADSVRQGNAMLIEQLGTLQADNKQLRQALIKSEQSIKQLRIQLNRLKSSKPMAPALPPPAEAEDNLWSWILFLMALAAGGGFVYWRFWHQPRLAAKAAAPRDDETLDTDPSYSRLTPHDEVQVPGDEKFARTRDIEEEIDVVHEVNDVPVILAEDEVEEIPVFTEVVKPVDAPIVEEMQDNDIVEVQDQDLGDNLVEFEAPIPTDAEEKLAEDYIQEFVMDDMDEKPTTDKKPQKEEENSIEFVIESDEPTKESIPPVKSQSALETLLALAQTYIDMDDVEAARQSLEEVLEFGSEDQKVEAQRMLDQLGQG